VREKNGFAKVFKNLTRFSSKNNFVSHQNNSAKCLNIDAAESFNFLAVSLNVLRKLFYFWSKQNYFQICIKI